MARLIESRLSSRASKPGPTAKVKVEEGEEADPVDVVPRSKCRIAWFQSAVESVDFVELLEMLANAILLLMIFEAVSYGATIIDQIVLAIKKPRDTYNKGSRSSVKFQISDLFRFGSNMPPTFASAGCGDCNSARPEKLDPQDKSVEGRLDEMV